MAVTNGWGQGVINNTNGWGKLATNSIDAGSVYQDSASGDTALIGTSAAFSYSASSYTQADADPTPTITGTTGGTFSGTSGLVFVSTSTGEIDLSASTIAAHVVTYTVGGVSSNFNLSVTAVPFSNVYSMAFDGVDDYIDCGNISALNGVTEATWMGWFNRSGTSSYYLFGTWGTTSGEKQFVPLQNGGVTGSIVVYMATSTGVQKTMFKHTYNVTATIGNWHHYAFVYNEAESSNADKIKVYMDGVELANTLVPLTSLNSSTANFEIGKLGGYSTNEFNGNIDEVAVFTSALSPSDISTIASAPSDLSSYSPTAWYRMGENGSWKYPQWLLPENSNKDKASNYSFAFDGVGDNIDLGTSILDGLGALSISFWFNTSYNSWQYFLGDNSLRILYNQNNDDLRINFNGASAYRADPLPVTLNTWNHMCMVYDGSLAQADRIKLYLNGSLATNITSGTPDTTFVASSDFRLGRVGSFSGNQFVGMMDEVAFFNTALTSANVTSIYNSGTPTTLPAGAVAHYKMGEEATFSTNWTVPDEVGSNDGTSSNMTIEDRVGEAPNSSNNSLSYNMDEVDRETDVPS